MCRRADVPTCRRGMQCGGADVRRCGRVDVSTCRRVDVECSAEVRTCRRAEVGNCVQVFGCSGVQVMQVF